MNAKKFLFVVVIVAAAFAGAIFGWKAVMFIVTIPAGELFMRLVNFCVGTSSSSSTD